MGSADSSTQPGVFLIAEDDAAMAPLKARLLRAGAFVETITFYELQDRTRITKTPALIVFHSAAGLANENDWEILTILLSRVHNLFPHHYTILSILQAAPPYIPRIASTGCQECFLIGPEESALGDRVEQIVHQGALPSFEKVAVVPERILGACERLGSIQQPDELAALIIEQLIGHMEADRSSVWIRERTDGELKLAASQGLPEEVIQRAGPPAEGSIIDWVLKNNQPLLLYESIKDTRFQSVARHPNFKSSMCLPMSCRGQVLGVMTVARTRPNARYFTHSDLQACAVMASTAAMGLQNARLVNELIQRERLATVGQTIASVAHCMKNIFTALNGGLYLLEHGITHSDLGESAKALDILQRSSARLNMLVMNMLDYSKTRKAVREEIHLRELFDEVTHLLVPAARQKSVDIETSVAEGAEIVYLDQSRLYRALVNLGTNAIDAMNEGGLLSIRALSGGEPIATEPMQDETGHDTGAVALKRRPIIIEVSDTGMGIPPDILDRLFEPFFSTKGSKGTGLGLASVKQFVDEQGGRIEVQSTPGAGTTFRLIF
ncbi:MAG: hypothetical protein Kow0059_16220 [Candidatus Sumerlaeia bacterium]